MTGYVNRWGAVFGWVVLMLIVWALFVPRGLSVGTFTLMTFTGVLTVLAGSALWRAQGPVQSIRQVRATIDSDDERRKVAASRLVGR